MACIEILEQFNKIDIYVALFTILVEQEMMIWKKIKEFAACLHTLLYLKTCSFLPFKLKYLKVEFSTFLEIAIYWTRPRAIWIYVLKNGGHRARLGENDLSSSEGARANHAKKWCAERMRKAIERNHLNWNFDLL